MKDKEVNRILNQVLWREFILPDDSNVPVEGRKPLTGGDTFVVLCIDELGTTDIYVTTKSYRAWAKTGRNEPDFDHSRTYRCNYADLAGSTGTGRVMNPDEDRLLIGRHVTVI